MEFIKNLFQRHTKRTDRGGFGAAQVGHLADDADAGCRGLPPLTDHERSADEDNPKGYYEFEQVKALKEGDWKWIPQAHGKAVKIISALLEYLPANQRYKIIFMRREIGEILASQHKMLERRAESSTVEDEQMAQLYQRHLERGGSLAGSPGAYRHAVCPLYAALERPNCAGAASA